MRSTQAKPGVGCELSVARRRHARSGSTEAKFMSTPQTDPHYTLPNDWELADERLALLGATYDPASIADERQWFWAATDRRARMATATHSQRSPPGFRTSSKQFTTIDRHGDAGDVPGPS